MDAEDLNLSRFGVTSWKHSGRVIFFPFWETTPASLPRFPALPVFQG